MQHVFFNRRSQNNPPAPPSPPEVHFRANEHQTVPGGLFWGTIPRKNRLPFAYTFWEPE